MISIGSPMMQCYMVYIHGNFGAAGRRRSAPGFHCTRYVLARSAAAAERTAFDRVLEGLDRRFGHFAEHSEAVVLTAEEIFEKPGRPEPLKQAFAFYRRGSGHLAGGLTAEGAVACRRAFTARPSC